MSARHLPSLAAVHFHLAPGKQQQQQQQSANRHSAPLSSSSSYTTSSMSSSSRQRRSWPREQELPDIDEDPFAHFLSPMTEEELESPFADHDDALSFSAGIIVSDDEGVGDDAKDEEKSGVRGLWGDGATRDKLRSGLARRWANAPPPGLHQIEEDRDAEMEEEARAMEREMERNMAVDEGYMSEEVVAEKKKASQQQQQQRPKRPGPDTLVMSQQPYRAVVREPTKGRAQDLVDGRMSKRRKYRHSWRAPDRDLFTVVEEQAAEGGDASEIELPYFSAF
ncbi:hypothetical protein BC567DRAFT_263624 [Phyllosticta citribraziliensis]